jgi:glucose-1-phosphate thymidylyltransferase
LKGVVLAAGKGTRLYPVTHFIPKPLLPLANRMILEYAFDKLKQMGVFDVCIVVGESHQAMREALGDGASFGLSLSYALQPEQKGLAHALQYARDFVGGDDFVLYLGDALYSEDLTSYVKRFQESGCANLNLIKHVDDPRRFGVVTLDGERIVKVVEKPKHPESHLALAGLYFFRSVVWDVLPHVPPSHRGEHEITDAIQMLIDRGELVLGGLYGGEWYDTGTLDSFLEAHRFLTSEKNVIDSSAYVGAELGKHVTVGKGASVRCEQIEDSVVLPGACVEVYGKIRHAILGGRLCEKGDLINGIFYYNPE